MGVLARATSERGEVVLRGYDEPGHPPVLELRVNGVFVMDTRETTTEIALATRPVALTSSWPMSRARTMCWSQHENTGITPGLWSSSHTGSLMAK